MPDSAMPQVVQLQETDVGLLGNFLRFLHGPETGGEIAHQRAIVLLELLRHRRGGRCTLCFDLIARRALLLLGVVHPSVTPLKIARTAGGDDIDASGCRDLPELTCRGMLNPCTL